MCWGAPTFLKLMYCLMASMRAWNSALAAFMLVIMEPTFPTMVAKISTPTWGGRGQTNQSER